MSALDLLRKLVLRAGMTTVMSGIKPGEGECNGRRITTAGETASRIIFHPGANQLSGGAMTGARIACPRCGQDWLVRVRLVHLGREAILCQECDALWQAPSTVRTGSFEDYGAFMMRHGRSRPEDKGELELIGALLDGQLD